MDSEAGRGDTLVSKITDPMERLIADGLNVGAFRYTHEGDRNHDDSHLDFLLTDFGVHVEVKRLHSSRIAGQMQRSDNIIVAQGEEAVRLLARLFARARAREKGMRP